MIPIPEFMFDDSISSKTKIINFNHFIKDKEVEAKPDLIIIEVPGELFLSLEKWLVILELELLKFLMQ
ncbi:hypothetical protein ACK2FY_20460 [Clostridioides difficile]